MATTSRSTSRVGPAKNGSSSKEEQVAKVKVVDSPKERIPSDVPLLYADQVMDVMYGIHTTKIVLSQESGGNAVRPVGVVVIPTAILLSLSKAIVRDLSTPGMIKETAQRFSKILESMSGEPVPPAIKRT